jgi:manganese transport system substrate-binding protein
MAVLSFIWRAVAALLGIVLLYVLAAVIGGLIPRNADWREPDEGVELFVRTNGVHADLVEAVATLPEQQRALVTCEGAFSYLARDAGLTEAYLWPVNSDEKGTPRQVTDVIAFVRENEVPAVFCESTVSDRLQRHVATEANTRLGGLLYVDSLSEPGGPVPAYLDLIRHDVETIVAGLVGTDASQASRIDEDS